MMFYKDARSLGIVFWGVVIFLLFTAATLLSGAVTEDLIEIPDAVTDRQMYCLCMGAGTLIAALICAINAHFVMTKKLTRLQMLRNFIIAVGVAVLVEGVLNAFAAYMYTDIESFIQYTTIATIAVGALLLLIGLAIGNGKKGFIKKVIWFFLVVAFILMAIKGILPAENVWQFAEHIAYVLIAFFMLIFVIDEEVRIEMGAKY